MMRVGKRNCGVFCHDQLGDSVLKREGDARLMRGPDVGMASLNKFKQGLDAMG